MTINLASPGCESWDSLNLTDGRKSRFAERGENGPGPDISLHGALNQPRCWLCDVTHHGELTGCHRVEFEAIPRDSLPAVGAMLQRAFKPEPQPANLQGRIRELDKDQLSFDLREIDGGQHTQRFIFDEELLGEVVRAFDENVLVKVAGRTVPIKNLAHALAVSRMSATGS